MQQPETTPHGTLATLTPRLMGFARLIRNLAHRFKGVARFLAVSGLLSGLWLAWYAAHGFGWSTAAALAVGVVLLLPALLLGWCWYVLDQACDLPERLGVWLSRAKGYAGETLQRLADTDTAAAPRSRLGDLGQMGGLLYELRSMHEDSRDLMMVFGGSLALTNPLSLLVIGLSAGLILLLDLGALLTGLAALFR